MACKRRRWRGPQPGVFYHARLVPSAVAIYKLVSGALEAQRWAALTPTHRAEPSGQPERPRITTHQWVQPNIREHKRT